MSDKKRDRSGADALIEQAQTNAALALRSFNVDVSHPIFTDLCDAVNGQPVPDVAVAVAALISSLSKKTLGAITGPMLLSLAMNFSDMPDEAGLH